MPTYHYRCASCGHSFDVMQRFSESTLTDCPACSGHIKRVIQPVGVVFKGSGWYINDSRKGGSDGESAKPAAKSESGTTDTTKTKSETKESSKTEKESPKTEVAKPAAVAAAD